MQRLLIISLFVSLSVALNSQGIKKNLGIEEIVREFYGHYDLSDYDYPFAAFEKKKEGWYVAIQEVDKNKLVVSKRVLFYSNKTRKYIPLPIKRNSEIKKIKVSEFLDDFTIRGYNLQLYYGYKGWYKDVVKELSGKDKLTDNQLNSLGRAYSTWAGGLISDQYGDTPESEIWQLPFSENCLNKSQIDSFNTIVKKGQDCFRNLSLRSPTYQTPVGEISMKYANEVMYQVRILDAYAMDYAKSMKIPENLYNDKQLKRAEDILRSCPVNSIFVSVGDNDFYPLHYLQVVKRFRRDVYVINYNLMGIDRYIHRSSLGIYEAEPVRFSASKALFQGNNNDLVYVKDSLRQISVSGLINILSERESKDENGRSTLFCDSIRIGGKMNSVGNLKTLSLVKAKYLFKNQWVLLDILDNLNGREICFGYSFVDELEDLNRFLKSKDNIWIFANN